MAGGTNSQAPHRRGLAKQIRKTLPVLIVRKDLLPSQASVHDAVISAGVFRAKERDMAVQDTACSSISQQQPSGMTNDWLKGQGLMTSQRYKRTRMPGGEGRVG
jgi:hypothetical protein